MKDLRAVRLTALMGKAAKLDNKIEVMEQQLLTRAKRRQKELHEQLGENPSTEQCVEVYAELGQQIWQDIVLIEDQEAERDKLLACEVLIEK